MGAHQNRPVEAAQLGVQRYPHTIGKYTDTYNILQISNTIALCFICIGTH